jgi:hypothetical protein
LEIANIDGSNVCKTKLSGHVCEILAISRTGRFVGLCLTEHNTAALQNKARLAIFDTLANTLQVKLQGYQERRFDEVSFSIHGWLSRTEWGKQGGYVKFVPGSLCSVRPVRNCTQLYSVFNWLVGGSSSCLYIEPEIDYPLDPQEQRWKLAQSTGVEKQLSISSSAAYLFSDRTIRLEDGSFVLSFGFSYQDKNSSVLTSHQTVLLPSSRESRQKTGYPSRTGGLTTDPKYGNIALSSLLALQQETKKSRCFTTLFDNNRKLGCLQLIHRYAWSFFPHWVPMALLTSRSEKESRFLDRSDYREHTVPENITAHVYIWDLCEPPKLIRDQALQLLSRDIIMLCYYQYRRIDVAFHPACDRLAIFNVMYYFDGISGVEFQVFQRKLKIPR